MGARFLYLSILLNPTLIEQRKTLGDACYETGDVLGTIAVLEPLATDDCNDRPMLEALEECYRTERMWDKVLRISRMRLALEPKQAVLRQRTANVLARLDRYEEAIELLRQGLPINSLDYLEQLLGHLMHMQRYDEVVQVILQMEKVEHAPHARSMKAYQGVLKEAPKNLRALEGMADLLFRNGLIVDAFPLYEEILRVAPERHDLRIRLVHFYQDSGLLERAEPHLVALMDAGQETADVALLYGEILTQREEFDKALMHFHFAVEHYPDDYRFSYFLAQIAFHNQSLEEALRWLDESNQKEGSLEGRTRIKALRRRVEDSMVDRDLQLMQERCNRDPDNMDLRLSYIREMALHGMAERAVGEYDQLLEERPELKPQIIAQLQESANNPKQPFRLTDYLADLKIKDQLWDEAFELAQQMAARSMHSDRLLVEHTRRILARQPNHLPSLFCLGDILAKQENWPEVLSIFSRYQKLTSENSQQVQRWIFLAHANIPGNYKEAVETGEAFLQGNNHDVEARLKLVHIYIEHKQYDEAFQHLQRAQSADYYNPEVTRLLREVATLRRNQQLERALETLEKDPQNTLALMEAGDIFIATGETKRAIKYFQDAAKDHRVKNLAFAKLANAMARLRMFDIAEETLDEVKLAVGDDSDSEEQNMLKVLFYDSAEIFEAEEEPERALKYYKKIFRVDASFRNVVDKVESLGG